MVIKQPLLVLWKVLNVSQNGLVCRGLGVLASYLTAVPAQFDQYCVATAFKHQVKSSY